MDQSVLDLDLGGDSNFEPQQRQRSNTWPLPRPDNYVDTDEKDVNGVGGVVAPAVHMGAAGGTAAVESTVMMGVVNNTMLINGDAVKTTLGSGVGSVPKKNSSRRNAWGNMSYADLITQAIQSCADKRLTLSQIYDWMVQNVPYFKDKGDSNSSAGWKNSIRHNLSLHNRFMRVQNEGTGKSSWWMINPDAKPGKSARRRATSMETSKYEKKRGRVKKKVEALRAGLTTTPSPSSSVSEGLDMFPESPHPLSSGGGGSGGSFQLSPGDYRPRASSNASSIGRLSPIPAVESDGWSPDYPTGLYHPGQPSGVHPLDRFNPDLLVDNMAESMKIRDGSGAFAAADLPHMTPSNGYSLLSHARSLQTAAPTTPPTAPFGVQRPPPNALQRLNATGPELSPQPPPYTLANLQGLSPSQLSPPSHGYSVAEANSSGAGGANGAGGSSTGRGGAAGAGVASTGAAGGGAGAGGGTSGGIITLSSTNSLLVNGYRFSGGGVTSTTGLGLSSGGSGLLRAALAHGLNNSSSSSGATGTCSDGTPTPSQMMSQLMGALNNNGPMPNDLDLNLDSLHGGFDCNVDEVIKHELSMDGSLDFNFSQHQQQLLHQQQQHQQHQQHMHLLHQQHHQQHLMHQPPADFNLGFQSTANVTPSTSQPPPPLCSLAALAPGRSWVR